MFMKASNSFLLKLASAVALSDFILLVEIPTGKKMGPGLGRLRKSLDHDVIVHQS